MGTDREKAEESEVFGGAVGRFPNVRADGAGTVTGYFRLCVCADDREGAERISC